MLWYDSTILQRHLRIFRLVWQGRPLNNWNSHWMSDNPGWCHAYLHHFASISTVLCGSCSEVSLSLSPDATHGPSMFRHLDTIASEQLKQFKHEMTSRPAQSSEPKRIALSTITPATTHCVHLGQWIRWKIMAKLQSFKRMDKTDKVLQQFEIDWSSWLVHSCRTSSTHERRESHLEGCKCSKVGHRMLWELCWCSIHEYGPSASYIPDNVYRAKIDTESKGSLVSF